MYFFEETGIRNIYLEVIPKIWLQPVAPADTSLAPAQARTPIKMCNQGLNQMILKILLYDVLQLCKQNSQVNLDE